MNTVTFNDDYPKIGKSNSFLLRASGLIPALTQTLAKGPGQYVQGIAPSYLVKGTGSHVWDADGNEYLDYNMGIGPLSLGYCFPVVDIAIKNQLREGITFSMMHPLEVEVAELMHQLIPNAEYIRFGKTGAEATSAAIRLARAYTGKNKILCCGYHGWHDWYISITDRNKGIPSEVSELTSTFDYNNEQSVLESIDENTACIILEPFVFEEPKSGFLHFLRDVCNKYGIVLIFDEMWTGFRIASGGAQEYFDVKADLACFSKAIANGMPLSALTGKKEIMKLLEKDVFFFSTFGGETLSLAAAKATIEIISFENVPDYLNMIGRILKDGVNTIIKELSIDYVKCNGFNCRTNISFEPISNPLEMKSLVQQEMLKRGVIWSGSHNISFSHTREDIEYTLKAYKDVFTILKSGIEQNNIGFLLKGKPVEPVFRRTSNFNIKPKQLEFNK